MFKTIAMVLSLVGAVCVSMPAHSAAYYNDFTIAELQFAVGSAGVIVVYSGGTGNPNPDGCGGSGRFVVSYTDATASARAMIAGVSMAFALGKTVRAYLDGCILGLGGIQYPQIKVLHVPQ